MDVHCEHSALQSQRQNTSKTNTSDRRVDARTCGREDAWTRDGGRSHNEVARVVLQSQLQLVSH